MVKEEELLVIFLLRLKMKPLSNPILPPRCTRQESLLNFQLQVKRHTRSQIHWLKI